MPVEERGEGVRDEEAAVAVVGVDGRDKTQLAGDAAGDKDVRV